jgi:hypothetical protein
MNAILVCVDYGDLLNITLPYNRHHFDKVMVVTTPTDNETRRVARRNDAKLYVTNSFYDDGALFNKWKALEEGLDELGRKGLLAIMDADVMWPKQGIDVELFQEGYLYSPVRHLWPNITTPPPPETKWRGLQAMVDHEWAGYTQIFYGEDLALPAPPWHAVDWRHAGGADSEFQGLWQADQKVRVDWPVLHLGTPQRNWAGRATHRVDGVLPPQAGERRAALRELLQGRLEGPGYSGERLGGGAP